MRAGIVFPEAQPKVEDIILRVKDRPYHLPGPKGLRQTKYCSGKPKSKVQICEEM